MTQMLHTGMVIAAVGLMMIGCGGSSEVLPQVGDLDVDCVRCEPTVRRNAVLGGSGPGVSGLGTIVHGDNDIYYVSHVHAMAEIGVYRRDGIYVRTIGREGDGPGEFRQITELIVARDSLHVFDSRQGRQTVLHRDGSFGRTRQLIQGIVRAWLAPEGQVLAYSLCPGYIRDCGSNPFHIFDDTSRVLSFGALSDSTPAYRRTWTAGATDATGFWAARRGQYRIYRWSMKGQLVDSIVRSVPWFPEHSITPFREHVRPGPVIRDMRVDEKERLWLVIHVADDRWSDQFREAPSPDMRFNGDLERYYDTVLEVIDLPERRVVAHARYDQFVSRITNRFELVAERETANGEPYLEVWAMRLKQ